MHLRLILTTLVYLSYLTSSNAEQDILIKHIYPPKCTILKESKVLLCPRIMEVDLEIKNSINKKLINCILISEEEEILAFGENYISPPGGKIYLTIRKMRRKIHEMKLIASVKCKYSN